MYVVEGGRYCELLTFHTSGLNFVRHQVAGPGFRAGYWCLYKERSYTWLTLPNIPVRGDLYDSAIPTVPGWLKGFRGHYSQNRPVKERAGHSGANLVVINMT